MLLVNYYLQINNLIITNHWIINKVDLKKTSLSWTRNNDFQKQKSRDFLFQKQVDKILNNE